MCSFTCSHGIEKHSVTEQEILDRLVEIYKQLGTLTSDYSGVNLYNTNNPVWQDVFSAQQRVQAAVAKLYTKLNPDKVSV